MQPQDNQESEDDRIVYNSTCDYGALAGSSMLLVLCSIAVDCIPLPARSELFMKAIATFGIALFGAVGMSCIKQMMHPNPGLILSNKGLFINVSAVEIGWIEWKDLAEVNIRWIGGYKYLCITFQNSDNLFKNLSWFKRLMMRLNRRTVGAELTLMCDHLPVSSEKLLHQIQARLEPSQVLVRPASDPHEVENLLLPSSGQDDETVSHQLLRAGNEDKSDTE